MTYEIVESRDTPDEWRVEAIDHEGDGEVYVAIFSGPDAEARAREYAAFKNASGVSQRTTISSSTARPRQ
jgi:hypothetical protein